MAANTISIGVQVDNPSTRGIPSIAYSAFRAQKSSAKQRGIEFKFTIQEWWNWWNIDDPVHGVRWDKRGRNRNSLVMARFNDVGPYSAENVYCTTQYGNVMDISHEARSSAIQSAWADFRASGKKSHLAVRGEGHPISRRVITPQGAFGSAALAAESHGITRQAAALRARKNMMGWSYE